MGAWAVGQHWDKAIFHLHVAGKTPIRTIEMSWQEWYEEEHEFFDNPEYARNHHLTKIEGWVFDAMGKCRHITIMIGTDGNVLSQESEEDD